MAYVLRLLESAVVLRNSNEYGCSVEDEAARVVGSCETLVHADRWLTMAARADAGREFVERKQDVANAKYRKIIEELREKVEEGREAVARNEARVAKLIEENSFIKNSERALRAKYNDKKGSGSTTLYDNFETGEIELHRVVKEKLCRVRVMLQNIRRDVVSVRCAGECFSVADVVRQEQRAAQDVLNDVEVLCYDIAAVVGVDKKKGLKGTMTAVLKRLKEVDAVSPPRRTPKKLSVAFGTSISTKNKLTPRPSSPDDEITLTRPHPTTPLGLHLRPHDLYLEAVDGTALTSGVSHYLHYYVTSVNGVPTTCLADVNTALGDTLDVTIKFSKAKKRRQSMKDGLPKI